MPTTNQLIYAQTLTSAASSVTFSSIPQTFTDLIIKYSTRVDFGGDPTLKVIFNSNTSNYSNRMLYGSGSSAISGTSSPSYIYGGYACNTGHTANTFSNNYMHIPNYTSNNYKSVSVDSVIETNATECYQFLIAGLWSNTSSITSISIGPLTGNLAAGSSLYLYGVSSDTVSQNTDGPYAFGGDTITTDGTYWYHTFLNSNSFTPQKNLTVDYLVVAGGAGSSLLGGGGAGGYRTSIGGTALSVNANTSYACTVGAGGAGQLNTRGSNGGNSTFNTISSTGGGGGGRTYVTANGASGGSGGGGSSADGTSATGGSGNAGGYSPVEGYAGGNASGSSGGQWNGGGGGGSSVAGSAGSVGTGGAGGNGTANSISGSSVTYAGGGGGGSYNGGPGNGGSGGGGKGGGSNTGSPVAGTANTGGGAGGQGVDGSGLPEGSPSNGGSGIIIIRYPV